MTARSFLLATGLLLATMAPGATQSLDDAPAAPVLRANIVVNSGIVRIGDIVDNAGTTSRVAIFRAPDLGTTGSVPTTQILAALRAHQVVGVETHNISEVTVTRASRTVAPKDIETEIAKALERRNGMGDASDITITFDRELQALQLDPSNSGQLRLVYARFEPRGSRFDVTLEIANDANFAPMRMRFTGTAIETTEAAVLTRALDRSEIIKASDVVVERRPKAEAGADAVTRDRSIGMQVRRPLRVGQPLRAADLGKPDLVVRDQTVSLVYETPGIYLTIRGKAMDSGTEGDTVSVMNLQSKRAVQGIVVGPGQVSVTPIAPRMTATATADAAPPVMAAAAAPQLASRTDSVVAQKVE